MSFRSSLLALWLLLAPVQLPPILPDLQPVRVAPVDLPAPAQPHYYKITCPVCGSRSAVVTWRDLVDGRLPDWCPVDGRVTDHLVDPWVVTAER
ncbi:MAG: hypothetical protein AB7S38_29100 [Vulcanimicrobiota bacterium]